MNKNWFAKNRFLLSLILILTVLAIISWLLGNMSLTDFFSNFSAEIVGAIITVFMIDRLIERHQKLSLQDVYTLVGDKIRLNIYETISKLFSKVISMSESDTVDLDSYGELLDAIRDLQIEEAIKSSKGIFKKGESLYHHIKPEVYSIVKEIAQEQRDFWADFHGRFQPHLSGKQFQGISDIIDLLGNISKNCDEVEKSLQKMDAERNLIASQLATALIGDLRNLLNLCLDLLKTAKKQKANI